MRASTYFSLESRLAFACSIRNARRRHRRLRRRPPLQRLRLRLRRDRDAVGQQRRAVIRIDLELDRFDAGKILSRRVAIAIVGILRAGQVPFAATSEMMICIRMLPFAGFRLRLGSATGPDRRCNPAGD